MRPVIAVIPARMGSLRMPRKNLCDIEPGLTLVQQAIDCALYSGLFSEVLVSSDEDIPFHGATLVNRPPELSGPAADITDAVIHAVGYGRDFDYVATLQPAVVARSPLIVRRLVSAVVDGGLMGGLTMAVTHRWVWQVENNNACNDWHGMSYPRSQDGARRLVEINAVQVAHRSAVQNRKRWGVPLAIMELPAWAAALDIDTPEDLETARALWPWAKTRLETWTGPIRTITEVSACA